MTVRYALGTGIALTLGLAFVPQGCGGAPPLAQMPEGVAGQLRACGVEHMHHLPPAVEHRVSFDVWLSDDGQVDSLTLRDSTLGDGDLERCMAHAVRLLSEEDVPLRRAEADPSAPVTPASRALLGHPEAILTCLSSPVCLLTVAFFLGGSYIIVHLYVQTANTSRPPVAGPQIHKSPKPGTAPGDPSTTGPTTPLPPAPDCPRNESFVPEETHNATGCFTKKGKLQCYVARHRPCAGVHTHGILYYQEIRRGECIAVKKGAVRCEGPFEIAGPCGSVSTTLCGDGGPETSGIFED